MEPNVTQILLAEDSSVPVPKVVAYGQPRVALTLNVLRLTPHGSPHHLNDLDTHGIQTLTVRLFWQLGGLEQLIQLSVLLV